MANIQIAKPPRKGEPPKADETVRNLAKPSPGGKIPLQLKIPDEISHDFKSYALAHRRNANDLFEEVWKYYKDNHG